MGNQFLNESNIKLKNLNITNFAQLKSELLTICKSIDEQMLDNRGNKEEYDQLKLLHDQILSFTHPHLLDMEERIVKESVEKIQEIENFALFKLQPIMNGIYSNLTEARKKVILDAIQESYNKVQTIMTEHFAEETVQMPESINLSQQPITPGITIQPTEISAPQNIQTPPQITPEIPQVTSQTPQTNISQSFANALSNIQLENNVVNEPSNINNINPISDQPAPTLPQTSVDLPNIVSTDSIAPKTDNI